jgi:hypothetical protein
MITEDTEKSYIRHGGYSLVVTIPAGIVREYQLKRRDKLFWTPEPDGIKLKIVHQLESYQDAEVQEAEVQETEPAE